MILPFALAVSAQSALMFKGYVAPHQASDGVRYQVIATQPQALPPLFRSCGIDDFAVTDVGYQFAVTTSTEGKTTCLRTHAPSDARVEKIDHWIADGAH